ncbi:MAG: ATP-binding cassette domain-containing protein [Deltaproteobacteria bacterium]|nr:ATP-binding cassette domain-containing protein [Deltaproteobacteria bacterium]
MPTHLLYQINNLKYRYGEHFELDVPELTIKQGSSIGFAGSNGSGKSTLLRILAFIELPEEGDIRFEGAKVLKNNGGAKRDVTMLLQEPYLLKRSVFENVAFGLKIRDDRKNLKERVYGAMELVGISPEEFARRRWHEISGGEAQRIALASRLILKPKVLILDEPTASVDQQSARLIKEAIIECRSRFGMSLIIASHDRVWLNSATDMVKRMHEGRIVGTGSENILSGPWDHEENGLYTKVLTDGQALFVTKPPHQAAAGVVNPSDIVISVLEPDGISTRNILRGIVTHMTMERDSRDILIEVDAGGLSLLSRLTPSAVQSLSLVPGKEVWALFKASAVDWY